MADRNKRGTSASAPPARDMAGIGIQFVATLLVFLFLGRWLGGKLGSESLGLVAGVFAGFVLGTLYMYRRLAIDPKQPPREEK